MATVYRVYSNSTPGGPVDFTTILATVSGLSWLSPVLPPDSDVTYAIRAYDNVLAVEESGVTATARVVTDGAGLDISGRPAPPSGLAAQPTANGGARVTWFQSRHTRSLNPTGFRVWATVGGTVNYAASPNVTVPFTEHGGYHANLSGLTDGVAYSVGVRAYNASGAETNVLAVSLTADATPPADVGSLSASLTTTG